LVSVVYQHHKQAIANKLSKTERFCVGGILRFRPHSIPTNNNENIKDERK
jgi:hypothetical protein